MTRARVKDWLLRSRPAQIAVRWPERLRACIGALIGIALVSAVTPLLVPSHTDLPWLIAPIGASAVLLFAVPASPLAQPWSIIGGNLIAAAVGVTCAKWFGTALLAAAIAVAFAIGAMFLLRCIHPPAGAVALTAVMGGPAIHAAGYGFVWMPVGVNSALLLLTALIYHALTRHSYPHAQRAPAPGRHAAQLGFTSDDLDLALRNYNELLDISRDDLETLLHATEANAYRRRFGEITCGDVMSSPVIAVHFGDSLEEAWSLLIKHRIKSLPVVDRSQRVIGIITQSDFLKHTGVHSHKTLSARLGAFVRRVRDTHSNKPEVVGQVMTRRVQVASASRSITELVPLFADTGHHHIPIIDAELRLVGIITQADVILALYHKSLREAGAITA